MASKANMEMSLEEAQAAAAQAQELAAAAQVRTEQLAQAADARRQAALRKWDQQQVAELDYSALTADIKEAREEFESAVRSDPVYAAAVRYIAALRRRMMLAEEQALIQKRLGLMAHDARPVVERPRLEVKYLGDDITRILDVAVNDSWADEADARDLARQEAGERAARG